MTTGKKTFPWLATLVTFFAIVTLLRLGFWQLERMHEKEERLTQLQQSLAQKPMNLSDVSQLSTGIADLPVNIKATLETEHVFYLDNRIVNGAVGYEIIVPAATSQGLVLLNWGWIKANERREHLPEIQLPKSNVSVSGNIVIPTLNPVVRETATTARDFPIVIQQIDIALMETMLSRQLLPFVVNVESSGADFVRNWQPVVMPPEKHLGYALQWFGLAFAALVIFLIALFKRNSFSD